MIHWFKRKYRQIKRVINFMPIIWRGADWDYRYAIDLFAYQLSRTADYIENNNRYVNAKPDSKRIRIAIKLMEKVYEEEYAMEYMDKIESKYGKSNLNFVETTDLDRSGDPYYNMVEVWERDYTESEQLLIEEEKNALMHDSRAKQKKAHKLLWNYIEHNIQGWWD